MLSARSETPDEDGNQWDPSQLINRHQMGVWRYLRALGCEPELADDLTQETFLAVLRKPFEQYSDNATGAYLRRVAHNLFITSRRRSARVTLLPDAEDLETEWLRWAGFDDGNKAIAALDDCFGRLTQRAQLALRMRFGAEASRQQIADELKVTEHGAKNLMQRAKSQLKDCVESKMQ